MVILWVQATLAGAAKLHASLKCISSTEGRLALLEEDAFTRKYKF